MGGLLTAVTAGAGNPLYSDSVSHFQSCCVGAGTELDHFSNTFVATDLSGLSREW